MQIRSLSIISILFFSLSACRQKVPLYREVSAEKSGIHFKNQLTENDFFNVMTYEYIYNGGGIGVGDFNNDSLPDIYFTGNMVENKLYLNKGNMQFEDVTASAGVGGNGKWCKGVSVVDINNDGLMDIYVSVGVMNTASQRKNLLYINEGINKTNGSPVFKESAEEYGLADSSSTQMAVFFDYDNDGDLDVYLLENDLDGTNPNEFRPIHKEGNWPNTDKLLRDDWDTILKHPVFTDVSKAAGILIEGYGLGVNITDINADGWKDIYVSNDYLSNNHLYINNKNGTFSDRSTDYFKHTSRNAMGNDIADINNDGLPDIIELDMAPADNYRLKMMNSPINYQNFQNGARYGYMHQYVRNTLQLNQGSRLLEKDSIGIPVFSEVGYFAGIAQTDWSWAPLAIDADNDGYRDIIVSNGLPKDLTDMNFIAYRNQAIANVAPEEILKQLPSVRISNYIFKNNGDITFSNKTKDWGWDIPNFSAGMAYADFDRDGDIDVIMNNTNMEASLMENTLNDKKSAEANYLRVQLQGNGLNKNGVGAVIRLFYDRQQQLYENTPYRGYLSSMENIAHFGLGKVSKVDSLVVIWPNAQKQVLRNIAANQVLTLDIEASNGKENFIRPAVAQNNWFTEITNTSGIHFVASEVDFIDFNIQRLIPHKLTQYGPSLAVGDVNGDGLDDVIAGGGSPVYANLFVQNKNGTFLSKPFIDTADLKYQDDGGICLFDADGDGDLDMYIASGGAENQPGSGHYTDHLYINDGRGNFKEEIKAIRPNDNSKSAVKAADYDMDGDLDLFIGGRVLPGSYPMPVSSYILRNDSRPGLIRFTDVTKEIAPALQKVGLVCDAAWSDIDNDGWPDLVIAGEWMPISFLKNQKGKFTAVTTTLSTEMGWWNSVTAADLDNDGDMDYVVGNFGMNGFLRPSAKFPIKVYGKDFDNNGSFDAIISSYLLSTVKGEVKEFPVAGRDEFIRELSGMKEKFPDYALYAKAEMKNIFPEADLRGAVQLSANNFYSSWVENLGNFQFAIHQLPARAQFAPVYGIVVNDFNGDGNMDIILNGNEFSMAPGFGRSDAFNGLVLQGDGKGNFRPLSIVESGIYIPGNGKSLVQLVANNKIILAAARNAGPLNLFQSKLAESQIRKVNPDDRYAIISLKNGKKRKEEFNYGSSFYSQSGRCIQLNNAVQSIEITNSKGQKRIIIQ